MQRIDCHNHTRYSNLRLRDALPTPKALIDRAIELGLLGISITEHDTVASHIKANQYALEIKEKYPNFKVILGNEIYLVDERPNDEHFHFVLNAKNARGHYQLRRLSSIAWLNSYTKKGLTRVDTLKSELEMIVKKEPGNLIASTACIGGQLGKSILKLHDAEKVGDKNTAAAAHNEIVEFLLWCKDLFKEDFYLEVQPGISKEQIIVNKRILSISKAFDIKVIPTSDSHYIDNRYVHKSYLNAENSEREVDAFYQDAYLHSSEEMIKKFKESDYDEDFIYQMFANTMEIYDKIEFYSLQHKQSIPTVEVRDYPQPDHEQIEEFAELYPVLGSLSMSEDKYDRYWVNECLIQLERKGIKTKQYLDRLEEEADIKKTIGEKLETNMFAYPITLQYYIDMMWESGSIVGAGRGSSCSGLNHYLLGVTQLDPIRWDLPFWRYLNKERIELPDIDIDVCPSKVQLIVSKIRKERAKNFREDLNLLPIEKENLGANYVCTFGTETTKSAVQTACRGYRSDEYPDGIDVDTAQYLSSLIPQERGFIWSLDDVINGNEEKGRKPVHTFINEVNQYPGLLDIMMGIEGCISRRGRHASGVLFLNEDPYEFNAFMKTPSGEVVTQYDLHDAEWAGSTKFDILVTEVQDKLAECIRLLQEDGVINKNMTLREVYDKYLHPEVLPLEDEKVWKAIQNNEVLNIFQFDSDVGSQAAKKIKPKTIIELADANGSTLALTHFSTNQWGA